MHFLHNLALAMLCIQAMVGGTKAQECKPDERCHIQGGTCYEPDTAPPGLVPVTSRGRPLVCDRRTGCVCYKIGDNYELIMALLSFTTSTSTSTSTSTTSTTSTPSTSTTETKKCLEEKTVAGMNFTLVGGKSNNPECSDDCLYSADGIPESRICFAEHPVASGDTVTGEIGNASFKCEGPVGHGNEANAVSFNDKPFSQFGLITQIRMELDPSDKWGKYGAVTGLDIRYGGSNEQNHGQCAGSCVDRQICSLGQGVKITIVTVGSDSVTGYVNYLEFSTKNAGSCKFPKKPPSDTTYATFSGDNMAYLFGRAGNVVNNLGFCFSVTI